MIGRLTGQLLDKQPPLILMDVHGVGYEINVPMSTFYNLPEIGSITTLHIHPVVREDMHLLFGFATETERLTFRQLIKISGIGTRTALAILSGLRVVDLHHAVVMQNNEQLIKIPGIGKKTAERLLLELRDKPEFRVALSSHAVAASKHAGDIRNALVSLGYKDSEASWASAKITKDVGVADGIRQALKLLSKGK